MTSRIDLPDARSLLEATRRALAACTDGLDAAAVQLETPLAALVFDSLMALNFIASLEADLGVADLPFERWLAEHSERADALTIGSLVEWLQGQPDVRAATAGGPPAGPRSVRGGGPTGDA